jgi:xylulose-5-phosphate/fructose-6-phosphate phosphoketolase
MVDLNETSRYHICMDAIRRSKRPVPDAHERTADCLRALERQRAYVAEHLEDLPEISGWVWPHS